MLPCGRHLNISIKSYLLRLHSYDVIGIGAWQKVSAMLRKIFSVAVQTEIFSIEISDFLRQIIFSNHLIQCLQLNTKTVPILFFYCYLLTPGSNFPLT